VDKELTYIKMQIGVGKCGTTGKALSENLNIKDTPFANNLDK
jgi:hypothetical protein